MRKLIWSLLRPCGYKVLVWTLTFFVFAPFIFYDNGIRCIRAPCPSESLGSILNFLVLSYNNSNWRVSYALLIFGLIASYIISAIIVTLVSKRESKYFCNSLSKKN